LAGSLRLACLLKRARSLELHLLLQHHHKISSFLGADSIDTHKRYLRSSYDSLEEAIRV